MLNILVTCPRCEGRGDEVDYRKVHSRSIEPPYVKCPECKGLGEVDKEQAEDYNDNKTLHDYEDERKFEEWEHRHEEELDRKWDRR